MFSSPSSRRTGFCLIACGIHALISIVGVSFPSAFGYVGKLGLFDDVAIYYRYALPILAGRLPYRDYAVEYPPGAIPFFVAPMVAGRGFDTYKLAFAIEMLLVDAVAVFLVARWTERAEGLARVPGRLAWYTAFFAILSPMIVTRFDLVPMTLAFGAASAMVSGRMMTGGLVAGLGVLVKLIPGLVIVPILAKAGPWRPKAKGALTLLATVTGGTLAWWWLGGGQILRTFRYHGERGLELGSIPASAYLLAHRWAGVSVYSYFDHGSMNLAGPGSGDAARLAPIVQGALLFLVAGRARADRSGDSLRFAAAALLAYVIPGKVLSPQYLIWLIPFLSVLGGPTGRAARWAFLAGCLLTTAVYPFLFHHLSYFETGPILVLAARSVSLIVLFAILIRRSPDHSHSIVPGGLLVTS